MILVRPRSTWLKKTLPDLQTQFSSCWRLLTLTLCPTAGKNIVIFRTCTFMPAKFSVWSVVLITDVKQIIIRSLLLLDIDLSNYPVKKTQKNNYCKEYCRSQLSFRSSSWRLGDGLIFWLITQTSSWMVIVHGNRRECSGGTEPVRTVLKVDKVRPILVIKTN